jgi:hypothetical protein
MKLIVLPIKHYEAYPWLLGKHYAHRIPPIKYSFGAYSESKELVGVCTFGPPCRAYNNGDFVFKAYRVLTIELNRLCINDDLPKNTPSFFISQCLSLLPSPCCVVSYSDHRQGHHGYIYQATNFVYTGLNDIHDAEYIINGVATHSRTLTGQGITAPKEWARVNCIERTENGQKHRYFMFIGSKKERRKMLEDLIFPIEPYPKGNNKRYDSSAEVKTQGILF